MTTREFAPADYPAVARIHNATYRNLDQTAESMAGHDRQRDPTYWHQRWVALEVKRVAGCRIQLEKTFQTGGTMQIRKARMEDGAGLAKVQVDSYRTAYAGIMPQAYLDLFTYEEQEQDWRDWISSQPDDALYVAETGGGEIVGYALARSDPGVVPPYDSELVALHVHRSHQRQGLGRRLVAAVAKQLRQEGSKSLMLWILEAIPSRGFYERLSGQLLDERQMSGAGAPEVAYGWPTIGSLCEVATARPRASHEGSKAGLG